LTFPGFRSLIKACRRLFLDLIVVPLYVITVDQGGDGNNEPVWAAHIEPMEVCTCTSWRMSFHQMYSARRCGYYRPLPDLVTSVKYCASRAVGLQDCSRVRSAPSSCECYNLSHPHCRHLPRDKLLCATSAFRYVLFLTAQSKNRHVAIEDFCEDAKVRTTPPNNLIYTPAPVSTLGTFFPASQPIARYTR
jgi:hypothetical protein